jgi:hypothetical protein
MSEFLSAGDLAGLRPPVALWCAEIRSGPSEGVVLRVWHQVLSTLSIVVRVVTDLS